MSVQTQSGGPETDVRAADNAGEEAETVDDLPPDQVFHLLQNERRRAVLRYLRGVDGVVDMREVVENVAAEEYDTDPRSLSSTERQRVYIALYQSHLPKLADFGVIEYDQSRGWVERTPLADQLGQYLDVEPTQDVIDDDSDADQRSWSRYYALGTVGAVGLLSAAYLGSVPLGVTPGFTVAAVIVTVFAALTVARWIDGS